MNLYLENTGKGILITFLLLIGSMLYAQNNSKITIKKKNISLQTALADIRNRPRCLYLTTVPNYLKQEYL